MARNMADAFALHRRLMPPQFCRNGHDTSVTGRNKRGKCKECKRLADARYYAEHTEKRKTYSARYRAEHPEEIKAYRARYYAEHAEEIRAQMVHRYWAADPTYRFKERRRAREYRRRVATLS
jgi:hypothetical protein